MLTATPTRAAKDRPESLSKARSDITSSSEFQSSTPERCRVQPSKSPKPQGMRLLESERHSAAEGAGRVDKVDGLAILAEDGDVSLGE